MNTVSENRRTRVALIAALALLIAVVCAYFLLRPGTQTGAKTVEVTVEHLEGEAARFTLHTDAEYLRGALEEAELIAGTESEYGLWVQTVDGETADESRQEWWGYTVNGELAAYGVDTQPIADGDEVVFTLNLGYEGW